MMVYALCYSHIDDYNIEKLFKSKEKAEKKCAEKEAEAKPYYSYWVDEYELEELVIEVATGKMEKSVIAAFFHKNHPQAKKMSSRPNVT